MPTPETWYPVEEVRRHHHKEILGECGTFAACGA
jgi:hypothetical protein